MGRVQRLFLGPRIAGRMRTFFRFHVKTATKAASKSTRALQPLTELSKLKLICPRLPHQLVGASIDTASGHSAMARLVAANSTAARIALFVLVLVALTAPAAAAGKSYERSSDDDDDEESDATESLIELATISTRADRDSFSSSDANQQWSFVSKYNGDTGLCLLLLLFSFADCHEKSEL